LALYNGEINVILGNYYIPPRQMSGSDIVTLVAIGARPSSAW